MTYRKNQLVTVYAFDAAGHYTEPVDAQVDPREGKLLIPDNCVTVKPALKSGCYYIINDDKTGWTEHKWPGDAAACVGIFIEHTDHCAWAEEMRRRFEELTEASTQYEIVRDEPDLCMTVEKIPEPTPEETAAAQADADLREFDDKLTALKDRMALAMLTDNQELIAQLRAEYKTLIEGA